MSVTIKTAKEIELMRHAGKLLEEVHSGLAEDIRPGITTGELDKIGGENDPGEGDAPLTFSIIMDFRLLSVFPSTMR